MRPYVVDTNVSEIITNIDLYAEKFLQHRLLAFRKLNCSEIEALSILDLLGQRLNKTFKDNLGRHFRYQENHSRAISRQNPPKGKDDILIGWHLENPSYPYPQQIAGWLMTKFLTNQQNGTTGFVDMTEVAALLPESLRDFAQRASYAFYGRTMWSDEEATKKFDADVERMEFPIIITDSDVNKRLGSYPHDALEFHPNTGEPVLRLSPWHGTLYGVDNRLPTVEEREMGQELFNWAFHQVVERPENQYWWEWSQGDFLIPDLFRLTHAVRGGFLPEEREFIGFWGFPMDVLENHFDGEII